MTDYSKVKKFATQVVPCKDKILRNFPFEYVSRYSDVKNLQDQCLGTANESSESFDFIQRLKAKNIVKIEYRGDTKVQSDDNNELRLLQSSMSDTSAHDLSNVQAQPENTQDDSQLQEQSEDTKVVTIVRDEKKGDEVPTNVPPKSKVEQVRQNIHDLSNDHNVSTTLHEDSQLTPTQNIINHSQNDSTEIDLACHEDSADLFSSEEDSAPIPDSPIFKLKTSLNILEKKIEDIVNENDQAITGTKVEMQKNIESIVTDTVKGKSASDTEDTVQRPDNGNITSTPTEANGKKYSSWQEELLDKDENPFLKRKVSVTKEQLDKASRQIDEYYAKLDAEYREKMEFDRYHVGQYVILSEMNPLRESHSYSELHILDRQLERRFSPMLCQVIGNHSTCDFSDLLQEERFQTYLAREPLTKEYLLKTKPDKKRPKQEEHETQKFYNALELSTTVDEAGNESDTTVVENAQDYYLEQADQESQTSGELSIVIKEEQPDPSYDNGQSDQFAEIVEIKPAPDNNVIGMADVLDTSIIIDQLNESQILFQQKTLNPQTESTQEQDENGKIYHVRRHGALVP